MNKWQSVYKDSKTHRVEIVKSVLEANDINPVLVNKKVSAYGFGEEEILVAPDQIIKAIRVIKEVIKFE